MKKILVLLCIIFLTVGCSKEKISLNDYTTVEFHGLNESGKIKTVNVDTDKLIEDFPKIEKYVLDDITYELEEGNDGSLKNGDEVTVDLNIFENSVSKAFEVDNKAKVKVNDLSTAARENEKFTWDGFDITISDKVSKTKIDNMFSEYDGKNVLKFKSTITNNNTTKKTINMFMYDVYGPNQDTKLNTVSSFFMNSDKKELDFGSDILPGKTVTRNIYVLSEGKGIYYFYFDNKLDDQKEVQITIK